MGDKKEEEEEIDRPSDRRGREGSSTGYVNTKSRRSLAITASPSDRHESTYIDTGPGTG